MIKLQFGIDFYEELISTTVTDPETGEETETTEWVTKTRPMIYEADKAIKGPDYVHLLDTSGNITASFEGISDFSGYELLEGEWSEPEPTKG